MANLFQKTAKSRKIAPNLHGKYTYSLCRKTSRPCAFISIFGSFASFGRRNFFFVRQESFCRDFETFCVGLAMNCGDSGKFCYRFFFADRKDFATFLRRKKSLFVPRRFAQDFFSFRSSLGVIEVILQRQMFFCRGVEIFWNTKKFRPNHLFSLQSIIEDCAIQMK